MEMLRDKPRRVRSLKKSNSFRIRRMGNIIVCDCCGQGHQPGKNHLYDYPDNIDNELLCGICVQPLVDPVDTPCGHTFCYSCLKGHLRMQKNCPADQRAITDTEVKQSSFLVRKILDKLTVVCPNNGYCDQTMPRCTLEVHLKYHCPGSYVSCPREDRRLGCVYIGPRCQLEDHLWSCNYGADVDKKTGTRLPIIEGQASVVEIPKGTSDLGLSISWNEEEGVIVIDDIFPEGNAYRDGRLGIGDKILEINGEDIMSRTLAEATLALSAVIPLMRLTVYREFFDENSPDPELIELSCDDDIPLGIQIRSSHGQPGVFIHMLQPDSLADQCGLLCPGDRILEANGQDLKFATLDEAASIIAEISGNLKLLVSHPLVRSSATSSATSSDLSSRSTYSSSLFPSHHTPIYDEIIAPTGIKVGGMKCVILRKQPDESFGMNIGGGLGGVAGDLPIFISDLRQDSVAWKSGQIQRGDVLLKIDNIPLLRRGHTEAIQTIRTVMSSSTIKMELLQGDELDTSGSLHPDWVKWIKKYEALQSRQQSPVEVEVALLRAGSGSLGFSLVGGINSSKGNSPLYVRSITAGGIADLDGRLHQGDEIIRINGISLSSLSQEEAVHIIKKSVGDVILHIIPREVML